MKRFPIVGSTVALVAVTALVFAATGCGSSKKSSSGSNSTVTVTTVTTTTNSSTVSSTYGTGTGSSTTSSGNTSGNSSSSLQKSCLNFAGAASKLSEAIGPAGITGANSENVKKYFDGLAAKAPSDIKSAFQALASAMGTYLDTIKSLDLKSGQTPSAADIQKLSQAGATFSAPELKTALTKINAWVKAGCHS